jgi:hypothetical protein
MSTANDLHQCAIEELEEENKKLRREKKRLERQLERINRTYRGMTRDKAEEHGFMVFNPCTHHTLTLKEGEFTTITIKLPQRGIHHRVKGGSEPKKMVLGFYDGGRMMNIEVDNIHTQWKTLSAEAWPQEWRNEDVATTQYLKGKVTSLLLG